MVLKATIRTTEHPCALICGGKGEVEVCEIIMKILKILTNTLRILIRNFIFLMSRVVSLADPSHMLSIPIISTGKRMD